MVTPDKRRFEAPDRPRAVAQRGFTDFKPESVERIQTYHWSAFSSTTIALTFSS
jgi:hypothetical protein